MHTNNDNNVVRRIRMKTMAKVEPGSWFKKKKVKIKKILIIT